MRNLVKPMMIVATDGHIIAILGPYLARNGDAQIIENEIARHGADSL